MRSTVVPNRNAVLLMAAAGIAVAQGCTHVLTAVHAGDHPVYPDCRPEFIDAARAKLWFDRNELIITDTGLSGRVYGYVDGDVLFTPVDRASRRRHRAPAWRCRSLRMTPDGAE
jgi:hypothetical protein